MATINILTTANEGEWRKILPATKNVFGSVEFAQIRESFSDMKAHLFVWSSNNLQIVYPFFLRSIQSLPFEVQLPAPVWDSITAEYTGPIMETKNQVDLNQDDLEFAADFSNFCRHQGIVAEFAHLNPWQAYTKALVKPSIKKDREIVYVDLTLSEEALWQDSFTYACRKNIRRAQKSEVMIFPAVTAAHISAFHRIYTQTMERNNSDRKYFFSEDFFQAIYKQMSAHARFMLAEYKGKVIAGTLYLYDNINVYSYLGGADYAFQSVRPTNAVVYETIRWAQKAKKKRLILGGGYREGDGIFRFKSSFSPLRSQFQVYKRVHLSEQYEVLCSAWTKHYCAELNNDEYFPAYRFELIKDQI